MCMNAFQIETIVNKTVFGKNCLENNTLYSRLKFKIDAFIGNAVKKQNFLKALESKDGNKWVFDCFDEVFSNKREWKPKYVVSHYRGLGFTNAKLTSSFTPSDISRKNEYDSFLDNYEKVQGDGRHTFNSLLYNFAKQKGVKNPIFVCCQLAESAKFMQPENKKHWLDFRLSEEICKILIGSDSNSIISRINNLNNKEEHGIKQKLEDKRRYALYSVKEGDKEDYKNLKNLLDDLSSCFSNSKNLSDSTRLEILQVLQGVCLFLKKFNSLLIALVTSITFS